MKYIPPSHANYSVNTVDVLSVCITLTIKYAHTYTRARANFDTRYLQTMKSMSLFSSDTVPRGIQYHKIHRWLVMSTKTPTVFPTAPNALHFVPWEKIVHIFEAIVTRKSTFLENKGTCPHQTDSNFTVVG